ISEVPFDNLSIREPDQEIAAEPEGAGRAVFEGEIEAAASGWLTAHCRCQSVQSGGDPVFASTSPVYLEVEGRPFQAKRSALELLISYLDVLLAWNHNPPRRAPNARPERLAEVLTAAREVLTSRLSDRSEPEA